MRVRTTLRPRTLGALTGSRVAGAMGRHIVQGLCEELRTDFARVFCAFAWIDNLHFVAKSGEEAIRVLVAIDCKARQKWGLQFKDGPMMLMFPRGSIENIEAPPGCCNVSCMPCLGHLISNDSGIRPSWDLIRENLIKALASSSRFQWRAFS